MNGRSEAIASPTPLIEVQGAKRVFRGWSAILEKFAPRTSGAILIGVVVWMWFPIVELVLMSMNQQPFRGIPDLHPTTRWYSDLLKTHDVGSALKDSIVIACVVASICAIGGFCVAKAFEGLRRKGLFLVIVLVPIFIPGLILGFGWLIMADAIGVRAGTPTLMAVHLTWAFPFAFLTMLIATSRIDARLREAAADLNAAPWQVVRDIDIPLLRSAIFAAFLFGFLLSFNELPRSIFAGGATITLPLYVWAQNASHSSTVPLVYALTTLILVGSLVCICFAYWLMFRSARPARLGQRV
jgi:ABC-type spermidine/putrescine transport system permease subunit II